MHPLRSALREQINKRPAHFPFQSSVCSSRACLVKLIILHPRNDTRATRNPRMFRTCGVVGRFFSMAELKSAELLHHHPRTFALQHPALKERGNTRDRDETEHISLLRPTGESQAWRSGNIACLCAPDHPRKGGGGGRAMIMNNAVPSPAQRRGSRPPPPLRLLLAARRQAPQ